MDLHWDPEAGDSGRYTSWDFLYKVDGDEEWTVINTDLDPYSRDSQGYPDDVEVLTFINRPSGADIDANAAGWIYFDDIRVYTHDEPATTLIPEPATMLIMAFGSLALLKRRR